VETAAAPDSHEVPRIVRLTLLAACLCAIAAAPALGRDRAPAGVATTKALETEVLVEINALRRARGLAALRVNAGLAAAAAAHSVAMARGGFFAHESADGSPFWKRVKSYYGSAGFARWSVGENLVWAAPELTPKQAVTMWMNSPPHRKNLLSPQWREIGLGGIRVPQAPGVFAGQGVTVLTADFGARS
jgi:uncharacterized protein YkwD